MKEKKFVTVEISIARTPTGSNLFVQFRYNNPEAIVEFFDKNTSTAKGYLIMKRTGMHIGLGGVNFIMDRGTTMILGCKRPNLVDPGQLQIPIAGDRVGRVPAGKYINAIKDSIDELNQAIGEYMRCQGTVKRIEQPDPKQLAREFTQVKKAKEAYEQAVKDSIRAQDLEDEKLADYNRLKEQLIKKL